MASGSINLYYTVGVRDVLTAVGEYVFTIGLRIAEIFYVVYFELYFL